MSQPSHQPATDTQMHSQVIAAYGKPLESATAALPEPKAAEVRVRVTQIKIAIMQMHIRMADTAMGDSHPHLSRLRLRQGG